MNKIDELFKAFTLTEIENELKRRKELEAKKNSEVMRLRHIAAMALAKYIMLADPCDEPEDVEEFAEFLDQNLKMAFEDYQKLPMMPKPANVIVKKAPVLNTKEETEKSDADMLNAFLKSFNIR